MNFLWALGAFKIYARSIGHDLKPGIKNPTQVEMEASDSIENLKMEIKAAMKLSIGVDQMRLNFEGKQLEDGRTLGDYGIGNEAKVSVLPPLKGY